MQSQTTSPSQASLGDTDIEENVSHVPETSDMITPEVKKQIQEAIKELRSK